jgi:hypothetical protein
VVKRFAESKKSASTYLSEAIGKASKGHPLPFIVFLLSNALFTLTPTLSLKGEGILKFLG